MIRHTAIIGMGALGLLYAEQITKGLGDPDAAEFVMDEERAARHGKDVYSINGEEKHFRITPAGMAQPADLVIVAVKYNSLGQALETMRGCVGEDTVIVSVMNGVTSEKLIAEKYGWEHMVYAVSQGMDAMRDGTSLHYVHCGKIHIGAVNASAAEKLMPGNGEALAERMAGNLQKVTDFFTAAKVPYLKEADILHRMWFKFTLNVGINQTCMVYDTNYGTATTEGTEPYEKMVGAMREVILAAASQGVALTEEDVQGCIAVERSLVPEGFPSMEQDRKAGRRSEVEMFAGEMIRMADQYGFEVPYNRFFYNKVREIEAAYGE